MEKRSPLLHGGQKVKMLSESLAKVFLARLRSMRSNRTASPAALLLQLAVPVANGSWQLPGWTALMQRIRTHARGSLTQEVLGS